MIYDMDTGHEHEITSFKNRHSAGEARILHICRSFLAILSTAKSVWQSSACVKPGQVMPYL